MKRPWKDLPDPTPMARQLWAAIYPHDPWPRHWTVHWAGWMRNAYAVAWHGSRQVVLNYGDAVNKKHREGIMDTLIHEFIHMRRAHRHDNDFYRLENAARARLGLGPSEHSQRRDRAHTRIRMAAKRRSQKRREP